jgi:hypothetical protein
MERAVAVQEIIDVPAPFFLGPQMPAESGVQAPSGHADVEVAAGF